MAVTGVAARKPSRVNGDMFTLQLTRTVTVVPWATATVATPALTPALAQTPALQMGAMYQCSPTQVLKLLSCKAETCDVQVYAGGKLAQRVQPNRQKLTALLAPCHVQTPQEAQAIARTAKEESVSSLFD